MATLQSLLQLLGVLALDEEAHHQSGQASASPSSPHHQQDTPQLKQFLRPRCHHREAGVQDQHEQQPQPQHEQQRPQPQHQQAQDSFTPQGLLLRLQAFCQTGTASRDAVIGNSSSSTSCRDAAPGDYAGSGGASSMTDSRDGSESNTARFCVQTLSQLSVQQMNGLTAKQISLHDAQLLEPSMGPNLVPGQRVLSSSSGPRLQVGALASVQHMKCCLTVLTAKHMAELAR